MDTSGDAKVIVCGNDWCGDTRRTLAQLEDLHVPFSYVDIDLDAEAEAWVAKQNGGKLKRPTVDVDGVILSVPSEQQLTDALRDRGLLVDSA